MIQPMDVFAEMTAKDNKALKLAPLSNINSTSKNMDGTTIIQMGLIDDSFIRLLEKGELLGGLFYVDRDSYLQCKKHLEEEQLMFEAMTMCNHEDRSTEYMLQFMQDKANVSLERVLDFLQEWVSEDE